MKKRLLIVAGALALALWAATSDAADCTVEQCIYVPDIQSSGGAQVTATGTQVQQQVIGPTPLAYNGCERNQPAPAEGAQAWMSEPNPAPRTQTQLCVRLVVNGRFVLGFPVSVVIHGTTRDVAIWHADESGGQQYGVAEFPLSSFDYDRAAGDLIPIDVAARYLDRTYLAQTGFVAASEITDTPTPTPTFTPTNTPTPTQPAPTATNTPTP